MFAEVQLSHLLEVVWVSIVAGIFVTVAFSFVVLGGARSAEARRTGNGGAAFMFAGLAVIAFLAFAAAVAFGVNTMLSKG
jgi:tetrahydromethanopterin S-methyltransferase subunit D